MGLGDIFGGVGRAFAGIGRWAEKERMALHYGSDWQDRLAKEQEFLDNYWQQKQRAEADDRFRQQAEDAYKEEERKEIKRKRALDATNEVFGIVKKTIRGGGDPSTLDPAIFEGLPVPPEAVFAGANQEIGAEDAEAQAKAEKEALQLEQIRAAIDASRAATERSNRPPKDVRETGQMTWDQALDNARQLAESEIPPTDVNRAPTPDRIFSLATDIMEQYGGLARGKKKPKPETPYTPSADPEAAGLSINEMLAGGAPDLSGKSVAVPAGLAVPKKAKGEIPPDPKANAPRPSTVPPDAVRKWNPARREWGWGSP